MSLHLDEDDRANLERLENRRMRPTRRQKAIALLRLASGLSAAEAAKHAGIPKEEVEALASGFADGGLAGVGLGEEPKVVVRLVRPGVGVRKYSLPNGATLADLLRRSGASTTNQVIIVDGDTVEGAVPLRDGAVVMIIPQSRSASIEEPWRATIPSFRDESLFQEYTEVLKARRADAGPDGSQEA